MLKRFFDIFLSLIAIISLSPLFLIVMLVLNFTAEGEIFFRQERVGKDKKIIKLFKFATMLKNSESIGSGTITLENDSRILPFGSFLRKTKINELPQLFNIFLGHMAIIGPRPQTIRCFTAFPEKSQTEIIKVRPGLSGIGSIIFRNEEKMIGENISDFYDNEIMPYKGLLEEWYVNNKSIIVDMLLIKLTVWVIFFPNSKLVWKVFRTLPSPSKELSRFF